jgi:nitrile hydratase
MSRAAIENLPPEVYLTRSYYEKWGLRMERLLLDLALVDADEIAAGRALRPGKPLPRKLTATDVGAALTRGSYARTPRAGARFKVDDRVRTRNINPVTHTRLPRYARGRVGTIECVRGCHVFPDSAATGKGEDPQWLYTLRFDGRELWGEGCDPNLKVSIEAFEPYLEAI